MPPDCIVVFGRCIIFLSPPGSQTSHSACGVTNACLRLCFIVLLPLQLAAAQEKAAQVTENIQVPPAEIPTNTEDLLRQRQAQLQQ
jgi:hypothetical protein